MKIKTARKILLGILATSLLTVFSSSGAFAAGALTAKSVSMLDSSPAQNTTYTFSFTTGTAAVLTELDFQFSNQAAGGTFPTFSGESLTIVGMTGSGFTAANWTVTNPSAGLVKLVDSSQSGTISANLQTTVTISGLTGPTLSQCTENTVNTLVVSSTCYVQMTTLSSGASVVDTGAASVTYINSITASATVDPSLTFTIGGLAQNTTSDGITTTQAGTYETLPFGDIVAGASSIVGQSLQVVTNANSGYTVNMALMNYMHGTTASNKIDPFTNNGSAIWNVPIAWTAPTGTDISGSASATPAAAFGANTNDVRVSGWGTPTGLYGSVGVGDTDLVANSTGPDETTVVDVLYRIQADVYQPADEYTGTIEYFAVAKY